MHHKLGIKGNIIYSTYNVLDVQLPYIWLAEGTCTILYLNIPMMSSFPSSDVQLRHWKWVPRARTCHRSGRDLASPGSLQKSGSFQQHIVPGEWNIHQLLVGIWIGCKSNEQFKKTMCFDASTPTGPLDTSWLSPVSHNWTLSHIAPTLLSL